MDQHVRVRRPNQNSWAFIIIGLLLWLGVYLWRRKCSAPPAGAVPTQRSLRGDVLYWGMLYPYKQLKLGEWRRYRPYDEQRFDYNEIVIPENTQHRFLKANGVPCECVTVEESRPDFYLLYLHGGGFILPLMNEHRQLAAQLARYTRTTVLLPNYRLAPEHPFPAALEDCLASYRWLLEQGIASSQIVILGDSAGGGLTFSLTTYLRDHQIPLPAALLAISPFVDCTLSGKSHVTNQEREPIIVRDYAQQVVDAYSDNQTLDTQDPLMSPLFANVRQYPPTMILVGSEETLLDDAARMAEKLVTAHIPASLEIWPGMPHVWPLYPEFLPESKEARQHMARFINEQLRVTAIH